MRASIQQDNKTILEDIEVELTETTPRSGLGSWSGEFFVSPYNIDEFGSYRLLLKDGRSGDIEIKELSRGKVCFEGSGPLA